MNKSISIILLVILSGCVRLSVTPQSEGRIIDADTKNPIEGAIVVVTHFENSNWENFTTSDRFGYFEVSPAKTWMRVPFSPTIWIKGNLTVLKDGYQTYECPVELMEQFGYKKADIGIVELKKIESNQGMDLTR